MKTSLSSLSRSTKVVLVLGAILALAAVTGVFGQSRSVGIDKEQAVAIAREQVDFEPEDTSIRLVRQGIGSAAVWAVSLSVPGPGGQGFERVTTVLVDARSGDVVRISRGG